MFNVLDILRPHISFVIEGGALGADRIAREWAKTRGVPFHTENAEWDKYRQPSGKNPAGPIRNAKMLTLGPQVVIAFPGGTGTSNMLSQARAKGIPTIRISDFMRSRRDGT